MSITEADRLAAEGVALELGGVQVKVRFNNRAKRGLEKRFGSLVRFERALNQARADGLDGPAITVCFDGLAAIVVGRPIIDARGRRIGEWTEERLDEALDNGRLAEFLDALTDAWNQAWPALDERSDDQGKAEGTTASTSPGRTTSPSPSSDSASPPTSSGT